jgi:hypothetical protein
MTFLVLCLVKNSVRHTGHFKTQALNGIEMAVAGVKSGSLASAD